MTTILSDTTMLSDTAVAVICVTAIVPLIGVVAADAAREVFPLRADLLSRLALVRLPDMLRRRGLGVEAYLRGAPRRQIAAQIGTCQTCPSKDRCDTVLRSRGETDFAFCPSNREIAALRQRLLPQPWGISD